MSSLHVQQVPTPYLSSGGTSIALPNYARPDLAYTNTEIIQPLSAGLVSQHRVPGKQVEIPQQISFTWVTSAVVGVRTLGVDFHDSAGNRVGVAFAAGQQSEGRTANYTFTLNATVVSVPNTFYVAALPAMLLQSTYLWVLTGTGLDVGDVQLGLTHTEIVVPTGPGYDLASAAVATPVLV